jgi:flagellar basal-body rod protein FlgB
MKLIDSKHSKMLANAMDAYSMRNKAIASNIANVDTPSYRRLHVNFEEQMSKAMQNGSIEQIDQVKASVFDSSEKVELEDEMMNLADNQIRTQMVAKELRHHFGLLRAAISGRPQG